MSFFLNEDIDIQYEILTRNLNESSKTHIPLTKHDLNPLSLPSYILEMIKFKKKLKRAYDKSGSSRGKENLYSYIDSIQHKIKRYKSSLWSKFVEKIKDRNKFIL